MQAVTEQYLLPQTCKIYPPVRVVGEGGEYSESLGTPLIYNTSSDIPCRLDITRHYRFDEIYGQELLASEFELHIPFSASIYADHKLEVEGQFYEITKLMDADPFAVTKSALVVRIDLGTGSGS